MKIGINLELLEKTFLGFTTLALVFFNTRFQEMDLSKTRG
jgi:hypothetical protein